MSDVSQLRIEAAHKKISEVFSKEYAFSIPAYQRPYAWEITQVEELLDDLTEAMKPNSISAGFYFLGSIVLVKTHGSREAKVVDGQQRLTTLTILFSVVRDLTEDAAKRNSREKYIKQLANDDEGILEALRLQLRQKDQHFFKSTIQDLNSTNLLPDSDGLAGSRARIVENAATIRAAMKNQSEEERSDLLRFLLQNCYLVVVEVPTEMAARRIFTVLNARGMDLSATDILKADLLEYAGEAKEDALSKRWEDLEIDLERDKFSDLFTHIRMIHERDKPRTALEKGFPEHIPIFHHDPTAFMNTVLEPYSYAFILSQNDAELRKSFPGDTADLIKSLDRLDNKDWLPPLLLCFRQSNENKRKDVPEIVFKLERLAYYLFMVRANVNTRMARYADVLNFLDPPPAQRRKISTSEDSAGLKITQNEASALFKALDGDVYLATRVVKPILLRLEQASTDGSVNFNYPTISVEHVCPQTIDPESQWAEWFPDQEDHSRWVHSLANLVLLNFRKNSSARNYDFEKKKTKYFESGNSSAFKLTDDVSKYKSWTPEDLAKRRIVVLERLANTWDLSNEFNAWRDSS